MPASPLQRALSHRQLSEAWERVRDNAGGPGVDGVTVDAFAPDLHIHLQALPRAVLGGRYRAMPLRECLIEKSPADEHSASPTTAAANAAKRYRHLAIPTVADRVLQTAVAMVLTPILEREFEDTSFAYRRGRGVLQATQRIERLRDEGFVWVVDADIESFFDHIPHAPLLAALHTLVRDDRLIALITQWLRAPIASVDGSITPRDRGVPQGSPLSPLLSNLYLDTLDEAMIDADHRIVRFADDFVILCRSQAQAESALALTHDVLTSLALRLNSEKTRIVDFNRGFRFLGVNFVRSLAIKSTKGGHHAAAPQKAAALTAEQLAAYTQSPPRNVRLPADGFALPPDEPAWLEHASESALQSALREANVLALDLPDAAAAKVPTPATTLTPTLSRTAGEGVERSGETISAPAYATTLTPTLSRAAGEGAVRATADAPTTLRTLPLLRTLYLVEQGAVVSREGDDLHVNLEGERVAEVGLPQLELVCVLGNIGFTTPALQACMTEGIPIAFMARTGKLYGMASGADRRNADVLRAQVLAASFDHKRLEYARSFVRAKLLNTRILVKRLRRSRSKDAALTALFDRAATALRDASWRTTTVDSIASLSGVEGAAAACYFDVLRSIIPAVWAFGPRQAFPAPDPVNAMLSFGYSLLRGNLVALINAQDLSPQIGFLHSDGAGHAALASDLMEEFRALVVDALVIDLISRRRLSPDDFTPAADGQPCRMSNAAARLFIHEFEEKMQAPINVRDAGGQREPTSLRHLMLRQVRELARALRGADDYVPFIGR